MNPLANAPGIYSSKDIKKTPWTNQNNSSSKGTSTKHLYSLWLLVKFIENFGIVTSFTSTINNTIQADSMIFQLKNNRSLGPIAIFTKILKMLLSIALNVFICVLILFSFFRDEQLRIRKEHLIGNNFDEVRVTSIRHWPDRHFTTIANPFNP